MDIEEMDKRFGLEGHASVEAGPGGLPFVKVANALAKAEISLMGAHVTSYCPKRSGEVLWMSPLSKFEVGKALRGGIPLCWPWFGKHGFDESAPMHGLARLMMWELVSIVPNGDEGTVVTMHLRDNAETRAYFNYAFELEYTVRVGARLGLSMRTLNTGGAPFVITQALHTYFRVWDITRVSVDGFDGCRYLDKVGAGGNGVQHGSIVIDREVDEVFQGCVGPAVIHDAASERSIVVEKSNSSSGIVWNPWIAKSSRMVDFPDDGYKEMLCVETANALEDARCVKPGESLTLGAEIYVK